VDSHSLSYYPFCPVIDEEREKEKGEFLRPFSVTSTVKLERSSCLLRGERTKMFAFQRERRCQFPVLPNIALESGGGGELE